MPRVYVVVDVGVDMRMSWGGFVLMVDSTTESGPQVMPPEPLIVSHGTETKEVHWEIKTLRNSGT